MNNKNKYTHSYTPCSRYVLIFVHTIKLLCFVTHSVWIDQYLGMYVWNHENGLHVLSRFIKSFYHPSRLTSTQFFLVIKVHHSKVSIEETGNKITPALDLWVLGLLSLSQTEQE